MRLSNLKLTILSVLLMMSYVACSKHTVPVIDYDNIAVVSKSGKALTLEDVKTALSVAAVEAKRNWQVADIEPGHAKATLVVRGKHTIVIDIRYSESKIAVKYSDSINMKYADYNGNREIHPSYNAWVGEYVKALERTLLAR